MTPSFYDLKAPLLSGEIISMAAYKGKVVLVVNTASKCGFTPQYEGLEKLYRKYRGQGFVILGFPCNQFAHQEPGDARAIAEGCLLTYGVSFPMFSKVEVNGDNTHPVFRFLKQRLKGTFGSRIKWNFTKFLIDRDGTPVKRFSTVTPPEKLEQDVIALLHRAAS